MRNVNNRFKKYSVIVNEVILEEKTGFDIVRFMRSKSKEHSDLYIDEYIKKIQFNVWKTLAIGINIDKELRIEEKCESLVEQLIKHKMLILVSSSREAL